MKIDDLHTLAMPDQPPALVDRPDHGLGAIADAVASSIAGSLSERRLIEALIDQIPDFLFAKDRACRFIVANRSVAEAYGTTPAGLCGLTDFDLHPPERAAAFHGYEQEVIRTGVPLLNMEESFPDRAGVQKWYSTSKVPLRDQSGAVVGLIGVARDITLRKRMESFGAQQSLLLEMIAMNAPLATVLNQLARLIEGQLGGGIRSSVLLYDAETGCLHNGAAPSLPESFSRAIDGVRVGPKVGSCGTAVFRREPVVVRDITADPLWEDYAGLAAPHGLRSCWSSPILSHDGSVLGTFALYSRDVREPDPAEMKLIEMATRIAGIAIERHQAEDRIRFMAHHDALTGLPNRSLLSDRLSQTLRAAARRDGAVWVAFVDLDNFKTVNDGLGHVGGDRLLQAVAAKMRRCVREADTVVRFGGDEFVLLLSSDEGTSDAVMPTLQRIRAALAEPIPIDGHALQVSCSIGVAVYPKDGADPETLLKNADAAMYSAKGSGRDRVQFYTTAMNAEVLEGLYLQEQLRHAIEREELHLVFQPQVNLFTGRIFAAEALVRWTHPRLGAVSPGKFIHVAEQSGLIVAIGDWVLRQACAQARAWHDGGLEGLVVSVNVSARQFREKDWALRVREILDEVGLEARFLELELTESMLMHDLQRAIDTMQDLKREGVHLAIDDFGTGYSSLSALKSFPVSRLKIDQSFVRDLADDENDRAIASAVISLGQKLGLRVIAEGVETREQLDFLVRNACNEVQGFLLSPPVSGAEVAALIHRHMASRAAAEG